MDATDSAAPSALADGGDGGDILSTMAARAGGTGAFHPEYGDAKTSLAAPANVVRGARALAVGDAVWTYAGCLVDEQKRVACWTGPNIQHFMGEWGRAAPPGPNLAGIASAKRVAMGGRNQLCAVLLDGSLACKEAVDHAKAAVVMTDVEEVAFGSDHGCALGRDGQVRCWGSDLNNALGSGSVWTRGTPIRKLQPSDASLVPGLTDAVAISASGYGNCAVTKAGELYCWGLSPVATDPARSARRIAAAHVQHAALGGESLLCISTDNDDHVRCVMRPSLQVDPIVIRIEPALPSVVDLAGDNTTACAVLADGTVWCWGPGPSREAMTTDDLRERARAYDSAAWRVAGVDDAVEVTVAASHACARTRAGQLRCWGPNANGELGDGTLQARSAPSWVVSHQPDLLPEPPGGVYGCRAPVEQRRSCYRTSHDCRLAASPEYWSVSAQNGIRCDEDCQARRSALLEKMPVPPCLCTCSAEYKAVQSRMNKRPRLPPPP